MQGDLIVGVVDLEMPDVDWTDDFRFVILLWFGDAVQVDRAIGKAVNVVLGGD